MLVIVLAFRLPNISLCYVILQCAINNNDICEDGVFCKYVMAKSKENHRIISQFHNFTDWQTIFTISGTDFTTMIVSLDNGSAHKMVLSCWQIYLY